ncbi:NAD(P)H-binding protein [Flammeovirga yaeyamensis]|uniref:NAD(P)H-binding protein n=1 Tax=Flammeovirga yaeyamensis TaxID=367791 RepID=A0AAX1NA89_9BACT|nr:SDR family oxidoreductase [Flammeovirga yaeyamensis]MBB3699195.1 NAD(P)H dehydrogenase (quinone) [Flammeovirga yaeyamensis]NMF35541.1 SDR family oxidoreductase [Flammeovirga yaeyamensis]QWG04399.1 NAD(P)H-binding protein [Flammeovirga yaeyamensis]
MKFAVTTASGNLGSSIIKHLKTVTDNANIIGFARTPEKAAFLEVEIRKGDYNSKEQFLEALKGVDVLILISGMDHPDKRIGQHRNVIEAAKENGVKKIVYTSIMGFEKGTGFSPVVSSNRQTEEDIRNSGMQWAIGRNGIYIEPDVEYIETYKNEGKIVNSAGEGKCGYTTRAELAEAYFNLAIKEEFNGKTVNLYGPKITQKELADGLNKVFDLQLDYEAVSVEDYTNARIKALGDFLGSVIGGIYEGINKGAFDGDSQFEEVTGRPHISLVEMIESIK